MSNTEGRLRVHTASRNIHYRFGNAPAYPFPSSFMTINAYPETIRTQFGCKASNMQISLVIKINMRLTNSSFLCDRSDKNLQPAKCQSLCCPRQLGRKPIMCV